MDFSSENFLFVFLPLVYAVYCIISIRMRSGALLLASLYFYASGDFNYLVLFIVFLALNYFLGNIIDCYDGVESRSYAVIISISANLVILVVFKYLGFFCETINAILLPIGISPLKVKQLVPPLGLSFLTFQAIAYLVDIYRQEIAHERNIIKFSLAFAFFPKLVAGPIIRMHQIEEPLGRPEISLEDFVEGVKRIIIGLGKKLILADTLAKTTDQIFSISYGDLTTPVAWLGIVCYTLQIYFDFSGYTDMAIGMGRLFGFILPENFNYPYTARSLTEFWRRWHISLSTWFRDYLYIPLSYALMTDKIRRKVAEGKYKTNYRALFSIFVVFTLCGLWHGASWNFVLWGMLHGLILALESWKLGKILNKCWAPLAHFYLLLVIMFCWVFFRIPSLVDALHFLQALSGFGTSGQELSQLRSYVSIELLLVLVIALLGTLPVGKFVRELFRRTIMRVDVNESAEQKFLLFVEAVMLAAVFIASLQAVCGTVSKPFIYAQF